MFIHATPVSDDLHGTIEITFFRVSNQAAFTSYKITQQFINNSVDFTVDLGTAFDQIADLRITGINAGQIGPVPPVGDPEESTGRTFGTETIDGQTVNAAVDELIRANSSAVLEGGIIPEPTSAALLTLGGAMLLARGGTGIGKRSMIRASSRASVSYDRQEPPGNGRLFILIRPCR